MTTIRVATRKSQLALTQTKWVIQALKQLSPELEFELVPVTTKGDKILDVTLAKVGGKGLFVSEIEQQLQNNNADLAVHSMKDMPAQLAPGLILGGVPPREDPRDALVSRTGRTLRELPHGAVVGTSSLRRGAQIKAFRPDLQIASIRGNIDTRLGKLHNGEFDAIILASSGLIRMGWADKITEFLEPDVCLPAVGQGILGIECRESDLSVRSLLERFTDETAKLQALAERSLLKTLNGSCQVPIAGYATLRKSGELELFGLVASDDGHRVIRAQSTGTQPEALGRQVGEQLLESGAAEILQATSGMNE